MPNYQPERRHSPLNGAHLTLTGIYRTLAIAAWSASGILYLFGLHADPVNQLGPATETTPLDWYAAAFLVMLLAMTFTARVAAEQIVSAAFAREAQHSRALLADAVAEALADELVARGLVLVPDGPDGDGDGNGDGGGLEEQQQQWVSRGGRR